MEVLRLDKVRIGYGRAADVVDQASLVLHEGETMAILGPSGGGKTSLLKSVAGLLAPRAGTMDVLGVRLPKRPPQGSLGYVPQRLGLVRHATVLENVLSGGLHEIGLIDSLLRRAPAALLARARAALEQLGLADKAEEPVHRLSGGQQRRTAVARALVQRPRLLLADEFLGELDPATMSTMIRAVKALQAETRMGLLVVEHNLDQALGLADRVFRLKAGRLEPMEANV